MGIWSRLVFNIRAAQPTMFEAHPIWKRFSLSLAFSSNPASQAQKRSQQQIWGTRSVLADVRNLTEHQELGNGYLAEYADRLGLNPSISARYRRGTYLDRINRDIESGIRSGVTDAPAPFINNIRYTGRWTITELTAAIVATSH